MIDAATFQAIAAVGALMLAMITLIGGWVYWLVRDLRADMRAEMREMRAEMRRNHSDVVALLEGHTHGDGTPPVFHRLPAGGSLE